MQNLRNLIVCGLVVGLASQNAFAVFDPTTYEARKTDQPPIIDGDLSDPAWDGAQTINQFFAYKTGGDLAASTGAMKILWDERNLYLSMSMDDDNLLPSEITTGEAGFDNKIWHGDVIEFFVREQQDSTRKHTEFQWSPNGDGLDARFGFRSGPSGPSWNSDMAFAVMLDGTYTNQQDVDRGFDVEAAIPLNVFDPIAEGEDWFFTFARFNFSPDGADGFRSDLMMTTPGDPTAIDGGVTHGFHTLEIYDRLVFVAAVPEPDSSLLVGCFLGIVCMTRTAARRGSCQLSRQLPR